MNYYTLGNPQEIGIAHRILGAVSVSDCDDNEYEGGYKCSRNANN